MWSHASLLHLESEKQCQASCRVDHRHQWLSLEAPQGCTPAIVFGVVPRGDHRVSAGVMCVWSALGHRGSFEMVVRPLEYIYSMKWILPPLEVLQECRDSLPL